MKNEKRIGLMLVEDPDDTLSTLCFFLNGTLDRDVFAEEFIKLKRKKTDVFFQNKDMTDSNIDAHFYTLTTFYFFIKNENKKYQLSPSAIKLCNFKKDGNWRDYQTLLSKMLLDNDRKGKVYQEFIKFVESKRTKQEIFEKFKIIPSKTLIAWSKHAGLIIEYKELITIFHYKDIKPSLAEFKTVFISFYKESDQTKIFGIRNIYVPIGELRFYICSKFGMTKKEFDEYLTKLLLSEFGKNIELHGSTSKVFQEEEAETFLFMDKLYVFLSVRV